MAEPVSALLRRSLGHLELEVPENYRLLLDRLGPLVVELAVDGEAFTMCGGHRVVVTDGPAHRPGVRVGTTRTAILDLLDARTGLDEAVENGAVRVLGVLDDILRAHDTLLAYVHAAVRAPSQPALLTALRSGAA
ncbi:hypothetical protein [Mycobacterium sp. GA-2829]|uniref:hypothetical protein n=1 Tax=Mycobacterium sp. GA-2829 TaxID=1772283 RepID=UPI0007404ACE|nr:hypothetical protein [Mycobacterium sp. GA-2829]KUI33856.1 SCP-2 sterol transfer family protein [Mycobacterium sp. GA-2829]